MIDPHARIAELELQRLTERDRYSDRIVALQADLTAARADVAAGVRQIEHLGNDLRSARLDLSAARAQLDTARAGLVAARDCLSHAMLRARKGPSELNDAGEWAPLHSELFCGVRDAEQVLASIPAQPAPTAPGHTDLMISPEAIDEALERDPPPSSQEAGEAYRLVPVDPTPEMVEAGRKAMEPEKFVSHARVLWVWEDMLNAAPIITSPPPSSLQAGEARSHDIQWAIELMHETSVCEGDAYERVANILRRLSAESVLYKTELAAANATVSRYIKKVGELTERAQAAESVAAPPP